MSKKSPYTDLAEFKELLRQRGLRQTAQRLAVHRAMMRLGHATAEMVSESIAKENGTDIVTASIYNILSSLSDTKIYGRRMSPDCKMWFDIRSDPHPHFYDTANHVMTDVPDGKFQEKVAGLLTRRRITGYHLDGVDVVVICHPTGRRKKKA